MIGLALGLVLGCGDAGDEGPGALEIRFQITSGGKLTPCKDVDGISSVEVTLLSSDGLSALPGYPDEADCESGVFLARGLAASKYVVAVAARGSVVGDDDAVLYRARQEVEFPQRAVVDIALAPEVAFFELSWSFEDALNPCSEVDGIDVFVSGGTAASAYSARFSCHETPVHIEKPLAPRSYTVQAIASLDGAPIYQGTAEVALAAGDNQYNLVLLPAGGRVSFDWRFEVAGAFDHACDGERVGVSDLSATIRSMLGDDPVIESLSCSSARPYSMRTARFTQGRRLELELAAEGVHRFRSVTDFTMAEGDLDLGLITLRAVGNATVALSVTSTSACASADLERFEVLVTESATGDAWLEKNVVPSRYSIPLEHLPYGEYAVEATGFEGSTELCRGQATRTISARNNDWPPVVLEP